MNKIYKEYNQNIFTIKLSKKSKISKEILVKNYIKQALAFNPTREKCAGYKPATDPKFRIATEYATPLERQMLEN
jgi:hypothetical protein